MGLLFRTTLMFPDPDLEKDRDLRHAGPPPGGAQLLVLGQVLRLLHQVQELPDPVQGGHPHLLVQLEGDRQQRGRDIHQG